MTAPDTSAAPYAPRYTLGDVLHMLSDPNAVHANLRRGTIARPSWAQIVHTYAAEHATALAAARNDALREAAEVARNAAYYATAERREGLDLSEQVAEAILALITPETPDASLNPSTGE